MTAETLREALASLIPSNLGSLPLRDFDDDFVIPVDMTAGEIRKARAALSASSKDESVADFQSRVAPWMQQCFGPEISADRVERGDRFLEEALELLQSGGYDRERIPALVDYVWNRPVGEPKQEVGGVMVTLAAYCLAAGLDMHGAGEAELSRINQPDIVQKIRAKQAAKARDIPFSPLPVRRQSVDCMRNAAQCRSADRARRPHQGQAVMTDISNIAASLSEAQKWWLTDQAKLIAPAPGDEPRWMTFPPRNTHMALMSRDLVYYTGEILPKGLAVRAFLEGKSS